MISLFNSDVSIQNNVPVVVCYIDKNQKITNNFQHVEEIKNRFSLYIIELGINLHLCRKMQNKYSIYGISIGVIYNPASIPETIIAADNTRTNTILFLVSLFVIRDDSIFNVLHLYPI